MRLGLYTLICFMMFSSASSFAGNNAHAQRLPLLPEVKQQDIVKFCAASPLAKPDKPGIQYNGRKANMSVLAFMPGTYKFKPRDRRDSTGLIIFNDGTYYLYLDTKISTVFTTNGDDLMINRQVLGGCNKEQLSEALDKNRLLEAALANVPVDPNFSFNALVETPVSGQ
jgi:hypothetical protein